MEIGFVSYIWTVGQAGLGVNWLRFVVFGCWGGGGTWDWVRFVYLDRGPGWGRGRLGSFRKIVNSEPGLLPKYAK